MRCSVIPSVLILLTLTNGISFANPISDLKFVLPSKCDLNELTYRSDSGVFCRGVSVGTPSRDAKGIVFLPLTFSLASSSHYVKKISVRIKRYDIHLCVEQGFLTSTKSASGSHSGPVRLGNIPAGRYQVLYDLPKKKTSKITDITVQE